MHRQIVDWSRGRWPAALAVLLLAVGCQQLPEEWTAPDWTPIAAVPLVDTRFDLGDVLEVVSDSAGTVPIELGAGDWPLSTTSWGTLAEEWLVPRHRWENPWCWVKPRPWP